MGRKEALKSKSQYFKRAGRCRPAGSDICPVPGCLELKPPAYCLCKRHWRHLPQSLQDDIRFSFRPGQERDGQCSKQYQKLLIRAINAAGDGG